VKLTELKNKLESSPEFAAEYAKADFEIGLVESLIKARVSAGLSQQDIAERMGVSRSYLIKIEREPWKRSISTLQRYAAATGRKLEISIR